MRDLIVLIVLVAVCVYALRHPWVGAVAGTVTSLASPHMAFGYAAGNWPVGLALAAVTMLGLLITKERVNPFAMPAVAMTLVLALWMCVVLPFSFVPELSYNMWERSMKIFLLLFISVALIDTRMKLDVFIWANAAAIGFYGVKGGVFSLLTGGQFIIIGPGGFIGGNNELALAEIMILPLLRYLQLRQENKWFKRGLGLSIVLVAISIIVSHSRGALLGMIAIMAVFWWRDENKLRWGLLILLGATVGLGAMPDEWWERMNTIKDYNEDSSAQGRINSWWLAWNIATERITGGGFVLTVPWIFERYAPNPRMIFVAHSIYFQMMGEQGFIGLFIFLAIGVMTWIDAARLRRLGKRDPALKWAADLGGMVQVSMVGFAVSGSFLSVAYFDLPYNIMAIAAIAVRLLNAQIAGMAKNGPAKTASAQPMGKPLPPRGVPGGRQTLVPRSPPPMR